MKKLIFVLQKVINNEINLNSNIFVEIKPMKSKILILSLAFSSFSFAQMDTIYSNNEKLAINVKEITEDAVKFTYPNEDFINTFYKNTINKIVFKSGRVQTFNESSSFNKLTSIRDYDKVTISNVESEVKGLFKIADVGAKAKGGSTFSSMEKVRNRAYNKIKMQSAMMGANVVYLAHQNTEGNKMGGYWQAGSTTETILTGVAYSNILLDLNDFKTKLISKNSFNVLKEYRLGTSNMEYTETTSNKSIVIKEILKENNGVFIIADVDKKEIKFRLSYYNESNFSLYYKDKSDANYLYEIQF
ncbi:hypothetical protein [Faecalibacter rhinopitheci]|uniref:Uncharacterized protein n=1 Tax=Faecalibacter rhinopitheci TaxID=2779678 RepID=A0A8J7G5Z1_9FLAO|nr:hypothetical protein [Faecalibacter rhinopitheci]MBF0597347.1 hypothetical protein [Faecalibacter rhinopitheci]